MDKTAIIIFVAVILVATGFWAFQSGIFSGPVKPVAIPPGIIFFYGQGCPHCKNVDDYIAQNKIADKVKFIKLEVWYNKTNQVILAEVAKKCGITSNSVGVPFIYDGGSKCYIGDVDGINFFKNSSSVAI